MADDGATYTHGHHESVLRSHTWRTAANSAAYLLPHLRPGATVLDVGCGPGTITADLARLVAPGPVLGIDPSAAIVAAAARDHAPGAGNLSFAVGDVGRLDVEDGSFDVVHAHQVLQHLQDPVAALAEMRRACADGGVVAARDADYAAMTWFPDVPGLSAWQDLYHRLAVANGGEPDAGRRLLAWANAAGFTEITASASVWCFATAEERAWWGGLWADRVQHSSLHEQALERGMATAAELDALAEAWRGWAAEPDGWFAVVHGEVLCRR